MHWHQIGRLATRRIKTGPRGGGGAIVGRKWLARGRPIVDETGTIEAKARSGEGEGLRSRGVLVLRVVKRGDKGNRERAKREQ